MFNLRKFFKKKEADEFKTWIENNTDGNNYLYLLGIDTKIRQFIDTHLSWVYNHKSMVLTSLDLYESAKLLQEMNEITEKEFEDLKAEMKKINFKSMTINW